MTTISLGSHQNIVLHTGARANVLLTNDVPSLIIFAFKYKTCTYIHLLPNMILIILYNFYILFGYSRLSFEFIYNIMVFQI